MATVFFPNALLLRRLLACRACAEADGTGLRRLTSAGLRRKFSNDSPAWSPDGKRIVFVSDRGASRGKASLSDNYVMNADGTGQKRLTRLPGWSGFPDWGARR